MSTPAESQTVSEPSTPLLAHPVRSPRKELEAFAQRRWESLRRVDADETKVVEAALARAIELLEEAETDDDSA